MLPSNVTSQCYFIFKVEISSCCAIGDSPVESVIIEVAVSNPTLAEKFNMQLNKMHTLLILESEKGEEMKRPNIKLAVGIAAEFGISDIHQLFYQLLHTADWQSRSSSSIKDDLKSIEGPTVQDEVSGTSSKKRSVRQRKKQRRA